MLYFVKLVVFVPTDSAADPEQANLVRNFAEVLFPNQFCRSIDCHFQSSVTEDGLKMIRKGFGYAFPSDPAGRPASSLAVGKALMGHAIRVIGAELQVRNFQPTESQWTVIESWRK